MTEGGRIGLCNMPETPTALREIELEYKLAKSYKKNARRKHYLACEYGEDEDH